jgi:hypothetical protein
MARWGNTNIRAAFYFCLLSVGCTSGQTDPFPRTIARVEYSIVVVGCAKRKIEALPSRARPDWIFYQFRKRRDTTLLN